MDTVLIQLTNQKAMGLLHEMEELHLIKVLEENLQPKQKLSERFAGSLNLTDQQYNDFQQHLTQSRSETVISANVGSYANDPYFERKASEAKQAIDTYGLPQQKQ